MCGAPGCPWGPGTCSSRTKHRYKKHPDLYPPPKDTREHRPSAAQGPGPSGKPELHIVARDGEGTTYQGTLGLVRDIVGDRETQLSPLVSNYISDQAEEGSGSDTMCSEPEHSSDSGDDESGAFME